MTFEQIALLALLVGLMAAYALDRWHVEVVALTGLAAAFLLGLVPADQVFTGFANSAVVTVIEILIIAQAIGRSRVVDVLARKVAGLALGEAATVALLCAMGAAISVFMNNIGALALMIPVAYSVCAARGIPLRAVLIPISFATLLGGLCSLIGTPANLVVNSAEEAASGAGFAFFAFAPVGLPLVILGILWLALAGWKLLADRSEPGAGDRSYPTDLFLTEVGIPAGSELIGRSVSEVERENQVSVHGAFRADARIFARKENQILAERDLILVSGSVEAIRGFLRRHNLQPAVSETETALPADRDLGGDGGHAAEHDHRQPGRRDRRLPRAQHPGRGDLAAGAAHRGPARRRRPVGRRHPPPPRRRVRHRRGAQGHPVGAARDALGAVRQPRRTPAAPDLCRRDRHRHAPDSCRRRSPSAAPCS